MSATLRIGAVTVELDDEAVAELARQVAPLVELGQAAARPAWIRTAKAAAAYLGCSAKHIHRLVELDRVEYRKDGRALMFRPEWLDAVAERAHR